MAKVEHDITTLVMAQKDFYRDRPNLARHNNQLSKVLGLLANEIAELNGHAADGMTLEKYREQEIADIVWFALGMLKQVGVYPSDEYLHGVSAELGVTPPPQWSDEPKPFSPEKEQQYWEIKALLEAEAGLLAHPDFQKADSLWVLSAEERRRLLKHLHRIIGLTSTLFYLLEVNPYDAVMEKMARNHAKHQAHFYTNPQGTYESGKAEANKHWGPKDNEEFYGDDPVPLPLSDEKREIGLGYRLVAQAIASLWGVTARLQWPRGQNR